MPISRNAKSSIEHLAKLKPIPSKKSLAFVFLQDNSKFLLDLRIKCVQSSLGITTRLTATSTLANISSLRGILPSANRK
jgi:hypothetical protein